MLGKFNNPQNRVCFTLTLIVCEILTIVNVCGARVPES